METAQVIGVREIAPGLYEAEIEVEGLGPEDPSDPGPTVDEQLIGTASDMLRGGRITEAEFERINALLRPVPEAAFTPETIRTLRKSAGVNQSRFAEIMGVTPSTASKWERGEKRPSGSAMKLLVLAKRHGLSHIM